VAKTRLLDAVNKGNLVVPTHIQQLESELKKELTKKERQAKSELKKKNKNDKPAPRGVKRKAEADVASHLAQKSKLDPSKPEINVGDTSPPKPKRWKQTAKRGNSAVGLKKDDKLSSASCSKQTAGQKGATGGMKEEAAEQSKLMARRGGISAMARGGTVTARGRANGSHGIFLSTVEADSSTRTYLYEPRKDVIICRAEGRV
jgi:hypothetical protein